MNHGDEVNQSVVPAPPKGWRITRIPKAQLAQELNSAEETRVAMQPPSPPGTHGYGSHTAVVEGSDGDLLGRESVQLHRQPRIQREPEAH